jgi:hypothetical protein
MFNCALHDCISPIMDSCAVSNSLECHICKKRFRQSIASRPEEHSAGFSRLMSSTEPSLRRHTKRCPEPKTLNFRRKSCKHCSLAKVRCDLQRPTCSRCLLRQISCQYVADVPATPVNPVNNETTLADQQQVTDVANGDSGPFEEHQPAAQVTESLIPGPDPLPPFSLEYVESVEPAASSGVVSTNGSHVAHESSMMTFEMDTTENQWALQLTPTPVTPPLVKHSMEFIFRVLRTWPGIMASEIQLPPIIHISQISNSSLPLPLANCFTLAKMWDGQRPGSEDLVRHTAVNAMTGLFIEVRTAIII